MRLEMSRHNQKLKKKKCSILNYDVARRKLKNYLTHVRGTLELDHISFN